LVQLASSFLKFRKDNGRRKLKDDQLSLREPRRRASQTPIHPESSGRHRSLVEVLAGRRVRLCGFGKEMSDKHREHLKAYGMVPGFWIDVIQQSPVTVLKIEHTELVLEHNLAINIQVVDEN
jgi:Fe2+ transport system protein FeoA